MRVQKELKVACDDWPCYYKVVAVTVTESIIWVIAQVVNNLKQETEFCVREIIETAYYSVHRPNSPIREATRQILALFRKTRKFERK